MSYHLPELPYAFDALEPHIDARTMEIHYDKHHGGYVKKLNTALEALGDQISGHTLPQLLGSLISIPDAQRTAVRNNGGGHYNHSLFWRVLSPDGGGEPGGALSKAILGKFGSVDAFETLFSEAAISVFGSGWCWLVVDSEKTPAIITTPNQDSPVMYGATPILGLDVWEHAYYLRYQNVRPDYVKAFWNVVNWKQVETNFEQAIG